jgi:hypothetical protein
MNIQGVPVKKLIVIVGLVLSFNSLAQSSEAWPSWKIKLGDFISKIFGEEWTTKILGAKLESEFAQELAMPAIPKVLKKSTDVNAYSKKTKPPTEFDKLNAQKRSQFDYKFIEELFQVTRKTEAKDEDLSNWLNTLSQGGSREGIYQALVLDEVYNGLESIPEQPSKKLLDYSLKFSQSFLNQTFKPESLSKLNLYSIKRIMTEKGLDVLEYFEMNDLDSLYRWYALWSADLAKNHNGLLDSPIRKEKSAVYHYEWAKNMPIQHIKSEYIVKMHFVMNKLQALN